MFVIKNASAIVTCDAQDRVIRGADILVEGPALALIGKGIAPSGAEVLDARGAIVYPGLVNTHHHFFQTFVRNLMSVDYPNLSDAIYFSSLTAMADLKYV